MNVMLATCKPKKNYGGGMVFKQKLVFV